MGNDVVKEKMCGVSGIVESSHGFVPFGKVIHFHDDVLVSIIIWRIARHEFYAPFSQGDDSDD